jgi:hypothetical protein
MDIANSAIFLGRVIGGSVNPPESIEGRIDAQLNPRIGIERKFARTCPVLETPPRIEVSIERKGVLKNI